MQRSGEDCADKAPRVTAKAVARKRRHLQCRCLRIMVRRMLPDSGHNFFSNVEQ